ncbi:MAG: cell division topological specificity factor MinE [Rhodocyclaceae bacterium]
MSLLNLLFGNKPKSATVAKERLQIIVARERGGRGQLDYLPMLQKELIEVISRYIKINPEDIRVAVEKQDNFEVLEVNIVLPEPGAPR